jgi:Raf kinase inhibitor-like YbhB/YbcL family protein
MELFSDAFEDGGDIPKKYTCNGDNIHPPLRYSEVPEDAKRLVLIVADVDSYAGVWVHWIAWNIHPDSETISEGDLPPNIKQGVNSFGDIGYGGPCPRAGRHRYFFRLYALDERFKIPEGLDWSEYEVEMAGHILEKAELVGYYGEE